MTKPKNGIFDFTLEDELSFAFVRYKGDPNLLKTIYDAKKSGRIYKLIVMTKDVHFSGKLSVEHSNFKYLVMYEARDLIADKDVLQVSILAEDVTVWVMEDAEYPDQS